MRRLGIGVRRQRKSYDHYETAWHHLAVGAIIFSFLAQSPVIAYAGLIYIFITFGWAIGLAATAFVCAVVASLVGVLVYRDPIVAAGRSQRRKVLMS